MMILSKLSLTEVFIAVRTVLSSHNPDVSEPSRPRMLKLEMYGHVSKREDVTCTYRVYMAGLNVALDMKRQGV